MGAQAKSKKSATRQKKKTVLKKQASSKKPRRASAKKKQEKAPAKKKKISAARQRLIVRLVTDNQEHGMRLAWSFLNRWRIRLEQDDVQSVVGAALVEAASRFDKNKGADFKTFFFYHLRGLLLKEITQMVNQRKNVQLTAPEELENVSHHSLMQERWPYQLVERKTPEDLFEKQQFMKLFWQACSELDELEQEIVVRHFVHDEPLKTIAEDLNYCRCHISRVKSKALSTLSRILPTIFEGSGFLSEIGKDDGSLQSQIGKRYTGGRGRRSRDTSLEKADELKSFVEVTPVDG